MDFTLNSFLAVLGHHTDVCVVDVDTDTELLRTTDFKTPYTLRDDVSGNDYIVVAVGTFGAVGIIVFVKRRV